MYVDRINMRRESLSSERKESMTDEKETEIHERIFI